MLTGQEIRDANLIIDGVSDRYRPSSYDLRIGQIVTNEAEPHANFKIPAQGIVQVVSMERVRVPPDLTGLATVKTSLCNEGILALNIGIIDPGYEGRISSFLVNFAKEPRVLTRGEPFLRLQFMPLPVMVPQPEDVHPPGPIDDAAYIARLRRDAARFGGTFLNISEQVAAAAKNEFSERFKNILVTVGGFALLLALLTFVLNFGSLALVKAWLEPSATIRAELLRDALSDQVSQLNKMNIQLGERLKALETRASPAPPATPPP